MSNNRKLNIEKVREIFLDEGCILLDNEYINSKTEMSFTCECGRTDKKKLQNFRHVPRCKWCSEDNKPKSYGKRKKYTYEEVKQYFEDNGCTLLSTEYIQKKDKLSYKCNCGRASEISFDKFTQGRRCKGCSNTRIAEQRLQPFSQVIEEFTKFNYQLLTLESEYIDAQNYIYYICDGGHEGKTTYHDFKAGVRCRTCNGSERHTLEFVQQTFKDAGCELLASEYFNAMTKMEYKCNCGHISEINYNNFSMGKRCKDCAGDKISESQRLSYDFIVDYFSENGCLLTSESYINLTEPLTYVCRCGRDGISAFATFKKSKQCKQCSFDANRSPDSTPELKIDRRHIEGYKEWVKACYYRDNYTCQCCGQRGGKLNAHHKDGYHWCEERRLDDTNSVTLCKVCHVEFHSMYGNKDNTEQQWIEFYDFKKVELTKERIS